MNYYKRLLSLFTLLIVILLPRTSTALTHSIPGISYTDVGHGTPLMLIHAWPTDQRLWKPQQDALKSHFRVITIDLGGFGQSAPLPQRIYSMEDYAYQVKQLLDHLKIEKAVIGGESMGGYVALAFLKQYPEHVQGLILSATQAIADDTEKKAQREKQAASLLADGTKTTIENFMRIALSAHAQPDTHAYLFNLASQQTATAMAASLLGIADRDDSSAVLSMTPVPVLILSGDSDMLILPQQSKNMHALAKNSRLFIIKNAGHLVSLEKPDEWNQAVVNTFSDRIN